MNKVIIILGQTSTGKSDFAVSVAQKFGGEIISADSRQVYRGMDLGTGKITKKEMQKIPHYLLDVVSPKKTFSVSDFQKLANKKINEIIKRKNIPIICGGTGFYIDAVVNGTTFPEVPPDAKLREKLSKKSINELFTMLEKLDKDRAKNIDKNNPVRLIRAIEITKTLGKVPLPKGDTFSAMAENASLLGSSRYKVLKVGLAIPPEILKEKIKVRLLARIKKGMLREIKNLHEKEKISWKRLESLGLEYRYVSYFLQGKLAKPEMIEKLNTEIWHYAKRQKTWFKKDPNTIWINPLEIHEKALALKKVKEFLK